MHLISLLLTIRYIDINIYPLFIKYILILKPINIKPIIPLILPSTNINNIPIFNIIISIIFITDLFSTL